MQEVLRLTDAEARLAYFLAEGRRIVEAANVLGIAINTARNQLSSIFVKTGVTSQSALMDLIARLKIS